MDTLDMKTLTKFWSAVATHVSKDTTRPNLCFVAVTSDHRIEATDGHRLVRIDTHPPHGLAVGLYKAKESLALLKAGVLPSPAMPLNDGPWPQTDRIIPKEKKEGVCFNVNARYLADAAEAVGVVGDKYFPVRFQPSEDGLSPIRIEASGENASALALVMPIRL